MHMRVTFAGRMQYDTIVNRLSEAKAFLKHQLNLTADNPIAIADAHDAVMDALAVLSRGEFLMCKKRKIGEFNTLSCCRYEGHDGPCNWYVADKDMR
jgi:hypothetical protein